jgi:hypothetical protein
VPVFVDCCRWLRHPLVLEFARKSLFGSESLQRLKPLGLLALLLQPLETLSLLGGSFQFSTLLFLKLSLFTLKHGLVEWTNNGPCFAEIVACLEVFAEKGSRELYHLVAHRCSRSGGFLTKALDLSPQYLQIIRR